MLRIGEFSKLSRVSVRMLRHYDEIGLLKPAEIDPFTGYRYYSEDQLLTAGRIAALKDMGFGLAAIGEIIDCRDDCESMERFLRMKRAELQELSDRTAYRLRLLDTALERLRKDDCAMNFDVTLKHFPERHAATVRMTLASYDQEGLLWSTMMSETAGMNLAFEEPGSCCVAYLDKEYRETDIEVEAQRTVRGSYPDTEHVKFRTLPPVMVASATVKGPYALLNDAMAAVARWVDDNGYRFDGPAFNIYHVSPHDTDIPEEFVTEICYPVCSYKRTSRDPFELLPIC